MNKKQPIELSPDDVEYIELKPEDVEYVEQPSKKPERPPQEDAGFFQSLGQTAEGLTYGLGSGLTLGGLEELIAGGQALTSSEKEDFSKLYDKYLKIQEEKEKRIKEESPYAVMAGEFAGSLLPAFVSGGSTLAASGGTAAGKVLGKGLLERALKGAAAGAASSAVLGGISGGLTSQEGQLIGGTEEEKQKLLEDIKSGALAGGVFGGAIGGIIPPVFAGARGIRNKAADAFEKVSTLQQAKEAYKLGKAGKGFLTSASKEARFSEADKAVEGIFDMLKGMEKSSIKQITRPLEKASKGNLKIKSTIIQPPKITQYPEIKKFPEIVSLAEAGDVEGAAQMTQLIKTAVNYIKQGKPLEEIPILNKKLTTQLTGLKNDLMKELKNVASLKKQGNLEEAKTLITSLQDKYGKAATRELINVFDSTPSSGLMKKFEPVVDGVVEKARATTLKSVTKDLNKLAIKAISPEEIVSADQLPEIKVLQSIGKTKEAEQLKEFITNGLSPLDAYNLKKSIIDIKKAGVMPEGFADSITRAVDKELSDFSMTKAGKAFYGDVGELPKGMSPYEASLTAFSKLREALPEAITEKGRRLETRAKYLGERFHPETDLEKSILQLIDKLSLPGTDSREAIKTMRGTGGVETLFKKLKKEYPAQIQKIAEGAGYKGPKAADQFFKKLTGKIEETSKLTSIVRATLGDRPIESSEFAGMKAAASATPSILTSRRGTLLLGNIMGQTKAGLDELGEVVKESIKKGVPTGIKKTTKNLSKVSRSVYKLPEQKLAELAKSMMADPKSKTYGFGKNLLEAIRSGDTVKKNAVLFAVLQQPGFRDRVSSFISEEEGEE